MDCDQFVELVTAYLEGVLEPATERHFIEHLAECDGCDRYLDQIRRTVLALRDRPSPGLTPQTRAKLLTALREHRPS